MANETKPTYIDLFAGCGGLSLGLHNAGWQGLFAIEKGKDAFETLRFNLIENKKHFLWPEWLPVKEHDINLVLRNRKNELLQLRGKVDMVTGGPPCQGFSTAGLRNEEDIRNKLINSYIRFINLVQPKVLFFENVKGFTMEFEKNAKKGKRYSDHVIKKLDQVGYYVEPELVNFADFGIPQKRCRFILVGVRKDFADENNIKAKSFFNLIRSNKETFLISKGLNLSTPLEEAISDLLTSNGTYKKDGDRFDMGTYGEPKGKYQLYARIGSSGHPDSHRFANHSQEIERRFKIIINTGCPGKSVDSKILAKFGTRKRNVILLNGKDAAPTITTLPDDFVHYKEPRILTVREYARIQSFPDYFQFKGSYTTGGKRRKKEVPRYTQIGNAIPPLFGEQSGYALSQLLYKKP